MTNESIHAVDLAVGQRIRAQRKMMRISQTELGAAVGVTFQQVQKYEKGSNRVSASMLWEIATVLKVPVAFFFGETVVEESPSATFMNDVPNLGFLASNEGQALTDSFGKIADPKVRQKFIQLVKSVAA